MKLADNAALLDRLAAAYALGTLRGGARRRFEALARQSPLVRAQALLWRERLASMTELQPAEVPSPQVWKRIHNVIAAEPRAAVAPPLPLMDRAHRWLALWRGAAFASAAVAIAAVSVVVHLDRSLDARSETLARAAQERDQLASRAASLQAQLGSRRDIQYVAVLEDEEALPAVLVTFDSARNTLQVRRVRSFDEGDDRSLQLWSLPAGGAPQSLGVLATDSVVRLSADEARLRQAPALAISLEPRGGAPAGSGPTGPVLFKGPLLQTGV